MAGVKDQVLENKGYQQLTSISSATALTVPVGARYAMIQCNNANDVRWRDDGTNPTTSIGMILPNSGYPILWYTGKLQNLRVISASGQLNVSYYG